VNKILDTFLLAYRTTPSVTLPQPCCPAELFFGRKPRTTLDLTLPTKQPTGRDTKMEHQFNRRHAAFERTFNGRDPVYVCYCPSHDWTAASVAKRIGGRIYGMTMGNRSTRRFHANQMRPRSTQLMDDDYRAFADTFNLTVHRRQATNDKTSNLDEYAGTTTNSPATRGLQRRTTSTQSSRAAHCRHTNALNEGKFLRNILSSSLVENHICTHKSGPSGTGTFSSLGVSTKKGRCWKRPRPLNNSVMFGYVRDASLGSFLFLASTRDSVGTPRDKEC
jgi:hypothetical protein